MKPYLADYHVHTHFSGDSKTALDAACEVAIARGLSEIVFTDHADFGPVDSPGFFRPVEFLAEVDRCRARYSDWLTIRAGVEMGEPHLFVAESQAVLAAGDFDVVLGSAHYSDDMEPAWKPEYFENRSLTQACEAYFRQVVRLAVEGGFDVLSHLDLIKRDARKFGIDYDGPRPYADMIRAALRSIVERDKGIEINTSPLRRGQPEPCPSLEILEWYHELGGRILTIGSDAHRAQDVGADFDVALDMVRSVGFTWLATFERREIIWVPLT